MSNSALVTYTNISPSRNSPRTHAIDTITIHCIVGQWTAKQGCDYFAKSSVQESANYVVGRDGSIGLCVDEGDRSWCSSSTANDHRAVTIETASDTTAPYAVTDAAYNALIELVTDICKRNGIKKLLWQGDKSLIGQVDKQNMTVHRWFANKACPGDYLYERHGAIAEAVNKKLGAVAGTTQTAPVALESASGYDAAKAGTYTVTAAAGLNIRAGAGTDKAVLGTLANGAQVACYGYYSTASGADWLLVAGSGVTGYASAAYLKAEAVPAVDSSNDSNTKEDDEMLTYEQWKEYMDQYRKELSALPASGWAGDELAAAKAAGITDGQRPRDFATREEAAAMAMRSGQPD